MALYNNPYQYSFGVPGQMNQFQQQPVQMPAQPVQQPQQNNNGILWVSGEVGAKSYLVAPGTKKWSTTTLSLMRCAAATMTITANVEESATAWGDTAQMMAE